MKRLDITAKHILENFQKAHFNQTGKRMGVGSEEHTLSSILSSALEDFMGLLNKSYKDTFTATAEGKYLDNLAERYGLSRHTEQWTNPFFGCQFTCNQQSLVHDYEIGTVKMRIAGVDYENSTRVVKSGVDRLSCIMRAVRNHNNYLGAAALQSLIAEVDLNGTVAPVTKVSIAGKGLQQCGRILNNDEDFRDYLQGSKYMHQQGLAGSFESIARAYADFIVDAKCATQSDLGYFTPGYVDLYLRPDTIGYQILDAVGTDELTDELKSIMSGVIGQTIRVHVADRHVALTHDISIKVSPDLKGHKFSLSDGQTLSVEELCVRKIDSLMYYYNQRKLRIGKTLYWNEFLQDLVNPLTALSDRPSDFGTIIPDAVWDEALKDFAFEGIISGDTGMESVNHVSYIHLSAGSVVIDEIQY